MSTVVIDQDYNKLFSIISKKDSEYAELITRIVESTDKLSDSELSVKDRYSIIVSIEFLLVRLRILITSEHMNVKSIVMNSQTPPYWLSVFKNRDSLLTSHQQRLIELRDDLTILQKVIYTQSTYKF